MNEAAEIPTSTSVAEANAPIAKPDIRKKPPVAERSTSRIAAEAHRISRIRTVRHLLRNVRRWSEKGAAGTSTVQEGLGPPVTEEEAKSQTLEPVVTEQPSNGEAEVSTVEGDQTAVRVEESEIGTEIQTEPVAGDLNEQTGLSSEILADPRYPDVLVKVWQEFKSKGINASHEQVNEAIENEFKQLKEKESPEIEAAAKEANEAIEELKDEKDPEKKQKLIAKILQYLMMTMTSAVFETGKGINPLKS